MGLLFVELPRVDCRFFADVRAQSFGQAAGIVGKNLCVDLGAGDGHVGKARVDEILVNIHIHIDKHSIRREPLAGVAGHGVAVVEIAHLPGVKGDGFSAVHLDRDLKAVLLFGRRRDVLDCAKVAVGHSKFLVGHGELEPVAHGNIAVDLSVDRDSFQPLRVIRDPLTVWFLDGQIVLCSVNVHNSR